MSRSRSRTSCLIDLVGYSKLLINEQIELLQELKSDRARNGMFSIGGSKGQTQSSAMGDGMALLFLVSCLLSYWALRSRGLRRMHRLEKFADAIFIIAMIGMVAVCALVTYSISI